MDNEELWYGVPISKVETVSNILKILGYDLDYDCIVNLLEDHGLKDASIDDIMRKAPDLRDAYLALGDEGFSRVMFVVDQLAECGYEWNYDYAAYILEKLGLQRASKEEILKRLPDIIVLG